MKVLVVDRDEIAAQLIRSKLEPLGHRVVYEPAKNNAVERLSRDAFDVIFMDPSPLTSLRPVILNIRRTVGSYPYIFLMTENASREDAIKTGANDIMSKPMNPGALDEKLANAERLLALVKRIGDTSEDFPSAGGVIAKSAFNQLFLSSVDRADRYGEGTYILFISLSNYQDIRNLDGAYAADYAVAKLSQYLVLLRRQSDIIGQTAKHEYALLLQRPVYDTEPVEASNRFAESLAGLKDIASSGTTVAQVSVKLIAVPTGQKLADHAVFPNVAKKP